LTQKEFYKSLAWKRARQGFITQRLAIDGGLCQVCGEEPGKIVHHTTWLDDVNCNDPDISLNPARFLYECQTCHNKEKDPRTATPGRCLYGPNGEIIKNTGY
jgi:5-methylcytosine-specific restriction endonuclease McrA